MIYYFSATGNCKYTAMYLADITNDKTLSVTKLMNDDKVAVSDRTLCIVTPTYFWGLPKITEEFLKKLIVSDITPEYVCIVSTYGTTPGQSGYFASKILRNAKIKTDALFGIKMPDTWTPIFDLSNKEKVKKQNELADSQIIAVGEMINQRRSGDFQENKFPLLLSMIYNSQGYKIKGKTKYFSVDENCIGCSMCARNCPASAIEIKNGVPVWTANSCIMCLGCLHRCPKFAISRSKNTKKHGQYIHPEYKISNR